MGAIAKDITDAIKILEGLRDEKITVRGGPLFALSALVNHKEKSILRQYGEKVYDFSKQQLKNQRDILRSHVFPVWWDTSVHNPGQKADTIALQWAYNNGFLDKMPSMYAFNAPLDKISGSAGFFAVTPNNKGMIFTQNNLQGRPLLSVMLSQHEDFNFHREYYKDNEKHPSVLDTASQKKTVLPEQDYWHRLLIVLHEASHAQSFYKRQKGTSMFVHDNLSDKNSEIINRWNNSFSVNKVMNPLEEVFADAYATVMLLEGSNHHPEAKAAVLSFAQKRRESAYKSSL